MNKLRFLWLYVVCLGSTFLLALPGLADNHFCPRFEESSQKEQVDPNTAFALSRQLLREGRRNDLVIRRMKAAVATRTGDYRFPLILGCAYAIRVSALTNALVDTSVKVPGTARAFTYDDEQPFLLSQKEAVDTIEQLAENAIVEWDRALRNAKFNEARVEVLQAQVWGAVFCGEQRRQ